MTSDELDLDAAKLSLEAVLDRYKSGKYARLYVVVQDDNGLVSDFVFESLQKSAIRKIVLKHGFGDAIVDS